MPMLVPDKTRPRRLLQFDVCIGPIPFLAAKVRDLGPLRAIE
jgi:hypothetical protein